MAAVALFEIRYVIVIASANARHTIQLTANLSATVSVVGYYRQLLLSGA
jgi:hypothetical protein